MQFSQDFAKGMTAEAARVGTMGLNWKYKCQDQIQ